MICRRHPRRRHTRDQESGTTFFNQSWVESGILAKDISKENSCNIGNVIKPNKTRPADAKKSALHISTSGRVSKHGG